MIDDVVAGRWVRAWRGDAIRALPFDPKPSPSVLEWLVTHATFTQDEDGSYAVTSLAAGDVQTDDSDWWMHHWGMIRASADGSPTRVAVCPLARGVREPSADVPTMPRHRVRTARP